MFFHPKLPIRLPGLPKLCCPPFPRRKGDNVDKKPRDVSTSTVVVEPVVIVDDHHDHHPPGDIDVSERIYDV